MSILSIDVGMKHLAYCVLKNNDGDDNYIIQDWNVIDLCNQTKPPKCMNQTKKCTKDSKYFKNDEYYCKIHAKKGNFLLPTSNFKIKSVMKKKLYELKSIAIEKGYDMPKKSKKEDYINKIKEDLSNNYFNVIENIDSRTIDIVTFGKRIKTCFNDIVDTFDIECVLIENQIGPLALRMKMIQGMIIQHFIEIGCSNIKEISPSNKLKNFIKDNKKTTYDQRKKLGIQVTRDLLNSNKMLNEWIEHFDKHKKKDDLSDAFLQVLWYIKY